MKVHWCEAIDKDNLQEDGKRRLGGCVGEILCQCGEQACFLLPVCGTPQEVIYIYCVV